MHVATLGEISRNRRAGAQKPEDNSVRWSLLIAAAVIVATGALFYETVASIVLIWSQSDLFGHGFFIVPIVVWLVWKRRNRVLSVSPRPALLSGLSLVAAMASFWLVGDVADVNLVRQLALVGMVPGIVLAVLGWEMLRALAFPVGYLFLAVPVGAFLIAPLQDVTAVFVVRALQLSGIPVFIDGIYLQTPTGNFLVAEACSGTRFLISTLAIGILVADLFFRSWRRRAVFMLLAVIVPIIANGLRAYGIVMVAHFVSIDFAMSADHITFGLVFMSLITLLLLLFGLSFRERSMHDYDAEVGSEWAVSKQPVPFGRATAIAAVASLTFVASAMFYSSHVQAVGRTNIIADAYTLGVRSPWQAAQALESGWKPNYIGADYESTQTFRMEQGGTVESYVGYYAYQRRGAELISSDNRVHGDVWGRAGSGRLSAIIDGQPMTVNYTRMLPKRRAGSYADVQGRIVWYWYWVDGRFTGDPLWAKFYEVQAILFGGNRSAAVVAIAADYLEIPANANEILRNFLHHLEPVGPILERKRTQETTSEKSRQSDAVSRKQAG